MADSAKSYAGLGPVDLVPSLYRAFDPATAGLSPEDYFLMTRVDGRTSLRQLVLISGFSEEKAVPILRKLRERGALLFPGETQPPAPPPPPRPATPPPPPPPPPPVVDAGDPRLAEEADLTLEQKTLILGKHISLRTATYFQVLEIPTDADKKAAKAAYRKMSKDFHPDRFFGKKLGSFKAMLVEIFDVASSAVETLSDDERREAYVASLSLPTPIADAPSGRGNGAPLASSAPQAPAATSGPPSHAARARAAELFEAASVDHALGELRSALEKFAAALAIDSQPRYLRRAAECALKAQELSKAEEYAKKARDMDARNAASHRIMSKVLRAKGQTDEARACLVEALRQDTGNPHILAELRALDDSLR